jgi:hypothetical protein
MAVAAVVSSLTAPDAPIALPAGASGRAALAAAAAALGLPPVRAARLTLVLARTGARVADTGEDAGIADGGVYEGKGGGRGRGLCARGLTSALPPLPRHAACRRRAAGRAAAGRG